MAVVICPKCGIIVPASKGVCMRCGAPLTPSATPVVEPVKPAPPVVESKREYVSESRQESSPRRSVSERNPHAKWGWVIAAILLFWPFGLVSLVLLILSNRAWKADNEKMAKSLGRVSTGLAIAGIVILILALLSY